MAETDYEHIVLNSQKQPIIEGTDFTVIELVLDKIAYGWSPEELLYQHPRLTLGQIYSALAYYVDHQEKMDNEIEEQLRYTDQLRTATRDTPLRKKLRSKNLL